MKKMKVIRFADMTPEERERHNSHIDRLNRRTDRRSQKSKVVTTCIR